MNVTAMRTLKRFSLKTNTITDPWSGADYANGAALFNPQMSWQNLQKNLPI